MMLERGRPSKYTDDLADMAYRLSLLGLTDSEMAEVLGIAESTFNKWKIDFPYFSESITRGKIIADAEVAEKLREKALGYSHPDVHISSYEGNITVTPIVKHYPPDTQAASLWLRNRQPERWRDKRETEHSGVIGLGQILDEIDGSSADLPED